MDSELEDLRNNFNAVLTSGGGHLSERQFLSDYRSLIGGSIPYQKLGYQNVRALIESLGGFYYTRNAHGETMVHAGLDEKTAHISKLIANQKKKPGAGKSRRIRCKLPSRLTQLRRPTSYAYAYAYTPRSTPVAPQRRPLMSIPIVPQRTYPPSSTPIVSQGKNPPIIPQRTVLTSVPPVKLSMQDRLEAHKGSSAVEQSKIPPANLSAASSDTQEPSLQEPSQPSFVDIQWLQRRVSNGKLKEEVPVKILPEASAPLKPSPSVDLPPPPQIVRVPSMPAQYAPIPLVISAPSIKGKSRTRLSGQAVTFKSNVEELLVLVAQLGLGEPHYKYIEMRRPRGKIVYIGKLTIPDGEGTHLSISSYPSEKDTCEEAQELVAQMACCELKKKLDVSLGSEPLDDHLIERVYNIIKDKPNGVFDEAIAENYKVEFKLSLPIGWLQEIENSPKFCVERNSLNQKSIIYPVPEDQMQLISPSSPAKPVPSTSSSSPKSSPPASPLKASSTVPAHVNGIDNKPKLLTDINSNTISHNTPGRKLPELVLPKDQTWDVFVASATPSEIWVRLIGEEYDVKYNDFMNELDLNLLSTSGQQATNPQVNDYYVSKFDNCWLRVQLKEIIDDGECVVFLIDNGEEDTIPLHELKCMNEDCFNLPAQAVRCKLAYVDLSYDEAQAYLIGSVIGSSYVAEILQYEDNCPKVVLHNTELEGEPLNLNYCILDEVVKKLTPPKLPQRENVGLFNITHIEKETPPFVQVKGKDLSLLETILEDVAILDLVEIHGVNAHPQVRQLCCKDKYMYLALSKQAPKSWRRAVIINPDNARNPLLRFIDFGYEERVMWSSIFDIQKVIPPLLRFPAQAVQVNLRYFEASQIVAGFVKRLRELAPLDSVGVLGKKVDVGSGDQLPTFEFFKRILPDNIMCSINSDIQFNYAECAKYVEEPVNGKSEQVENSPSRVTNGSTNPLPKYPPPPDADFFDIYVPFSSNPSNFVVQPVKELYSSFNVLMKELQEYYEAQHSIMPAPAPDDLIENATFAAKHPEDQQWYRVSIVAAFSESSVSARYSDYGDVGLITVERLRYLEPRFALLPALAVRAKLHGIKPKNIDWDATQTVSFNSLVENKAFVSKVVAVESDLWSLTMIDTSNEDKDVDLAALLVDKDIAEWLS